MRFPDKPVFGITPQTLPAEATDTRRGFDRPVERVRAVMGCDPLEGICSCNARRTPRHYIVVWCEI
jgi:hypothetical protein